LTFLPDFHAHLSRYYEMRVHYTRCKKLTPFSPPFCAPLAQVAKILTRCEFCLHKPVKFYMDPLRFVGVIREKPIVSKYILCCHAFAFSAMLQLANLLQNCYFCLIQKTISNSLLWTLLVIKYFWSGCFTPPCLLRPGATSPPLPPSVTPLQ